MSEILTAEDAARAADYPGFGGVPLYELAKGLVASGHRVSVVTTAGSPEADEARFKGPGIEVHCLPRRAAGPAIRDLYRHERSAMSAALRDCHPDIVHAHWTYEFELAAQDSGLPHVTTAHDAPFTILRQMRDPYRAGRLGVALWARPGIRHLSAVSPYMADRWRRQMRYRGPISVIPNSIPTSAISSTRRPSRHPTILEVADSGRLKNIGGLLRAFAKVRLQVPEAELRLVGPGLGALEPLALCASDQGLASGVSFLGPLGRESLADEYAGAWSFAHASLEESFGLTVLEALASGVPVIGGRDSGGVPFVLGNGRAGCLTDVTDAETFAASIVALIAGAPPTQTPDVAHYIEENFSLQSVTQKYVALYKGASDPIRKRQDS